MRNYIDIIAEAEPSRSMPRITTNDEFTAAARKLLNHDNAVELMAAVLRATENLVADVDDVDQGVMSEVSAVTISNARTSLSHAMGRRY